MCLAPIPPHEYSSENAFDTLVGEEERVQNENQHHIQEGFFQLIEELAGEDVGLPSNLNFEMISYGVDNALESFISYINLLNRASQFDEINPQFFKNNAYDNVSSHLHQEL
jgi:hypothetical protein